jgi:hypothetical protein
MERYHFVMGIADGTPQMLCPPTDYESCRACLHDIGKAGGALTVTRATAKGERKHVTLSVSEATIFSNRHGILKRRRFKGE